MSEGKTKVLWAGRQNLVHGETKTSSEVHGVHCLGRRAREHPTGTRTPETEAAVLGGFVASTLHAEKRPAWHGPTPARPLPGALPALQAQEECPASFGRAQRGSCTLCHRLAIKSLDSHFLLIYRVLAERPIKGCGTVWQTLQAANCRQGASLRLLGASGSVCACPSVPGHAHQLFAVELLPEEQALLDTQVCLTGLRTRWLAQTDHTYLLSTYCVLGPRLGVGDIVINKTGFLFTASYWGKQIKHIHTSKLINELF